MDLKEQTRHPFGMDTVHIRNLIFGVEDSLVSTVGLLAGVTVGGADKSTIFLAGMVLIFVEALSMGAGSFISEHAAEEYSAGENLPFSSTAKGAIIMFVSYFISGFIPLFPYIIFSDVNTGFTVSIIASLLGLLLLGVGSAKAFRGDAVRHGLMMLIVGGLAIAIGVIVGKIVSL